MESGLGEINDVLVVDDHPGDRRFIQEAFGTSQLDLSVHTVDSRDEALDVVQQRGEYEGGPDIDVILLDWNLSQTTSEEVLDAAKARQPPIPVIVMTGSNPEKNRLEPVFSRADMIIEKPTAPEGYIETIRTLQTEQ